MKTVYSLMLSLCVVACQSPTLPVDPEAPPVTTPTYSTRNWTQLTGITDTEALPQPNSSRTGSRGEYDRIMVSLKNLDGTQSAAEQWSYFVPFDRWTKTQADGLLAYNPVEFTIFDVLKNTKTFTGLGYLSHPESLQRSQYLKACYLVPLGRVPDYIGADAPTAFFVLDPVLYVLEAAGRNFCWFFDCNDDPTKGFRRCAPFPLQNITQFQTFVVGTKGYVLVEGPAVRLYEYNPSLNKWTRRADFPGKGRNQGLSWGIGEHGYYGLGEPIMGSGGLHDIWQYNPITNAWSQVVDYPGKGNANMVAQVIDGKAYLGLGYQVTTTSIGTNAYTACYDWWAYKPD